MRCYLFQVFQLSVDFWVASQFQNQIWNIVNFNFDSSCLLTFFFGLILQFPFLLLLVLQSSFAQFTLVFRFNHSEFAARIVINTNWISWKVNLLGGVALGFDGNSLSSRYLITAWVPLAQGGRYNSFETIRLKTRNICFYFWNSYWKIILN